MAKRKAVTFTLDKDKLDGLNNLAAQSGVSRSEVVNRILGDVLLGLTFAQKMLFSPEGARDLLQAEMQKAVTAVARKTQAKEEKGRKGAKRKQ